MPERLKTWLIGRRLSTRRLAILGVLWSAFFVLFAVQRQWAEAVAWSASALLFLGLNMVVYGSPLGAPK